MTKLCLSLSPCLPLSLPPSLPPLLSPLPPSPSPQESLYEGEEEGSHLQPHQPQLYVSDVQLLEPSENNVSIL